MEYSTFIIFWRTFGVARRVPKEDGRPGGDRWEARRGLMGVARRGNSRRVGVEFRGGILTEMGACALWQGVRGALPLGVARREAVAWEPVGSCVPRRGLVDCSCVAR